MRVYISGPINSPIDGLDLSEAKERFNRCEKWITQNKPGWQVTNPLNIGPNCVLWEQGDVEACGEFDGHSWECWLKSDLEAMLRCDGIVLLPDYESSRGATLEAYLAKALGYELFMADADGRVVL